MTGRIAVLVLAGVCAAGLAAVHVTGCVIYLNPLCSDQIRNGDETDIDCGGKCGRCQIGDSCRVNADCEDSTCEGGKCTPLPCQNGVRDQAETDVDCGGGTCRKCSGARHCVVGSDCVTGNCVASTKTCFSLTTLSFADAMPYESGNKAYVLLAGDFNGDNHLDLVAANELDSTLSVFLNNGTGGFQRLATPFETGQYPTGGHVADFNHDNRPDIVTADYHGNSVSILLGGGNGMLGTKASYPTIAGAETSNLAVGDLNGDGNLDVVATNPQNHSVSEFLGLPNGTLQPAITFSVGIGGSSEPFSAAIADFDGNGTQDLAIADNRSRTVIVRLGNGDGTFQPETAYADGGTASLIIIAADLNLDTRPDLIVANRGSSNITVLLARDNGTFRRAIITSTGKNTGPYALAVADFNQDGVPDVITANYMSSNATVLLGIGDGTFEPAFDAGPTGTVSYGVIAGDLNGDTKPDFAICNAISNNVTVKINTSH